ncbi:hypothetical protein L1856_07475 [Streptomyces sp. Tue 6430]|nr:hypothetical protein [Streptomyces sp. Tue 6430]
MTYLLPALALAFAAPALLRVLPRHTVTTLVAGAVLAWTLLAPAVRPRIFDTPSMSVYVVQGALAAFSAVVLVSDNQRTLLRPLRRVLERPTESGLAARLAVAYPLAKRFRTGATLVMYTLIMFVLVLLTEISGILRTGVDGSSPTPPPDTPCAWTTTRRSPATAWPPISATARPRPGSPP